MKQCSVCKKKKPLVEFNRHAKRPDGLQPHCRECNRETSRRYYQKNRQEHLAVVKRRNREQRRKIRQFLYDYLGRNPCIDCGEQNPCCLEFDHLRDKTYNVSRMAAQGLSLARVKQEIEKCEVRCANCHRKKTAKTFGWYRNIRRGLSPNGMVTDF
jgi:hypothetical protein